MSEVDAGGVEGEAMIPAPDPEYVSWVEEVQSAQLDGRRAILRVYEAVVRGRDAQIWKKASPPWQSFERCLQMQHGIHPQRFAHMEAIIGRFGRDSLEKYGFEASIYLLRLPPDSPAEKKAFAIISEMETNRGGRPPSAEAVARVVSQIQPAPRPLRQLTTEADRLRIVVRDLEGKLSDARKMITSERKARLRAEADVEKLRSQVERLKKSSSKTR